MAGVSPANVERVRLKLQRHELAAGDVLFREGDSGDCLFVLTRGSVTLAFSLNRDAHRIASFESGVIFGEITMLDGEKRSATAVADRQATVYSLSAAALQELQAADPELVNELLLRVGRHLARRLRVSTDVASAMADSAN